MFVGLAHAHAMRHPKQHGGLKAFAGGSLAALVCQRPLAGTMVRYLETLRAPAALSVVKTASTMAFPWFKSKGT